MNIFKKAKDIRMKHLAKAQEKDAYLKERLQEEVPERLRKFIYDRITEDKSAYLYVQVNFMDVMCFIERDVRNSLGCPRSKFPASGYMQCDVMDMVLRELREHFKVEHRNPRDAFEMTITMKED